jgi:hypothetical protein
MGLRPIIGPGVVEGVLRLMKRKHDPVTKKPRNVLLSKWPLFFKEDFQRSERSFLAVTGVFFSGIHIFMDGSLTHHWELIPQTSYGSLRNRLWNEKNPSNWWVNRPWQETHTGKDDYSWPPSTSSLSFYGAVIIVFSYSWWVSKKDKRFLRKKEHHARIFLWASVSFFMESLFLSWH